MALSIPGPVVTWGPDRSVRCPLRGSDRSTVVVKIGPTVGVIYVCETAFVELVRQLLWTIVSVCDRVHLSPPIPGRMPNAVVCAFKPAKGARRCLVRCATAKHQNASHKNDCAAVGHGTH